LPVDARLPVVRLIGTLGRLFRAARHVSAQHACATCALVLAVFAPVVRVETAKAATAAPTALLPVAGTCVFGSGATPLTATFSPRLGALSGGLESIQGGGSCTSNASANTVGLNLSFRGIWTCTAGEASGSGSATWSDGTPAAEGALSVTATGGPGEIQLWLHDPTDRFEASASLAWSSPQGSLASCLLSGGLGSTSLVGSMSYVAG